MIFSSSSILCSVVCLKLLISISLAPRRKFFPLILAIRLSTSFDILFWRSRSSLSLQRHLVRLLTPVAGAPTTYAALNLCEREEKRKVLLREFLSWSVPFTIAASLICYLLGMLIWVLPYAG